MTEGWHAPLEVALIFAIGARPSSFAFEADMMCAFEADMTCVLRQTLRELDMRFEVDMTVWKKLNKLLNVHVGLCLNVSLSVHKYHFVEQITFLKITDSYSKLFAHVM